MAADTKLQKKLGSRLRALRKEHGLSQLDMVRQFDFSLSHYQKLERGDLDPRMTTIARLAESFEITMSDLLEGV